MLGAVSIFGCLNVVVAMEMADSVDMEIAKSRCYHSDGISAYVSESNSNRTMNPKIDFRKYGYPSATLTSKQIVYEAVLQDARDEYTLHGLPFQPREFWKKPIEDQLVKLKDAILEFKLPEIAPALHQNIGYTDNKTFIGCGKASYPASLEKKFEEAVWKILSKDYKITLEYFTASLRSALESKDRLYTAPLLMHFTNYLVPRYEFYYKDGSHGVPYKTLKYPSIFEVANGAENKGKVVHEATK